MSRAIWKDVSGYEGLYQVSNLGEVRSLGRYINSGITDKRFLRGRTLKPKVRKEGYLEVALYKNHRKKWITVHRLVAKTFIPDPEHLPQVNHKDENKENNKVGNLEWCSAQYNINYGTRNVRMANSNTNGKQSKPILQISLDGRLIKLWPSLREAERHGFDHRHISACCRGKVMTAGGYRWKYAEEGNR